MYSSKNISIIIPNFNGLELLKKHIPAVIRSAGLAEIILADDCSTDYSVNYIRKLHPKINVTQLNRHEGFAGCVNAGVNASERDIIILINTDVEPYDDFIRYILPHFNDDKVFAVGCLEESYENDHILLRGRGEAAWTNGLFIHWRGDVTSKSTAWVSGGSGAFNKKIWNELGGFDKLYNPFYWEDIDISYRALKAGYKLIFEKKSRVRHFHEIGSVQKFYDKQAVKTIAYRNQFIFIWKNLSDNRLFLIHILKTPVFMLRAFIRGDFDFIIGYILALTLIGRIYSSRREIKALWKVSDISIVLK